MKLLLLFFSLGLILVTYGQKGWVDQEFTGNGTGGKGDCVSKNPKVGVLKLGEKKTLKGSCQIARCGEGGIIDYVGCAIVSLEELDDNCFIQEDLSKPYPNCCKKVLCKEVDESSDSFGDSKSSSESNSK